MILYMYLNEIYFYLNYDLIYMIFRQSDYVLIQIPSKWGLFIGTESSSIWSIMSLSCFWT